MNPNGHHDEWLLQMLVDAPASGFEISRRVRGASPAVSWNTGAMYMALHRLERLGLVDAEWSRLPGRPLEMRRYSVSARGLRTLCSDDHAPSVVFHPMAVVVALAVCSGWTTEAARQTRPRLAIVLQPRVSISEEALRRASLDVHRILGAAGIEIRWLVERSLSTPLLPIDCYRIHAELVISQGRSLTPVSGEIVLGVTTAANIPLGTADVVLFADHIVEFATAQQREASKVLALVIAHEVGHALLPPPAHADTGIMQVPWDRPALDRADEGALLFTARQAAVMRDRLTHSCEHVMRN